MKRIVSSAVLFVAAATGVSTMCDAADVPAAIQVLRGVEPGGVRTEPARKAVGELVESGPGALLPILKGFNGASPLAANWLRNAFEEIVSAQVTAGKALPAKELEAFVLDTTQAPVARRLAYETLRAADAAIETRIIPGLLLDPGSEFRRDAVALLIAEAEKAEGPAAIALYRKAMSGAVHEDQVQKIAEALRKAGETVDISRHFGFIPKWTMTGPFDNKDEKGFAVAYAPEKEFEAGKPNLAAEYDGQLGKVQWKPIETTDDYGVVDIAKQIENYKGSAMYATTTWKSDKEQNLELRLGTPNAWKIWVNGKLVFEREEYHRSSQMDQYTVPVTLKAGENVISLKICQNEMTQEWAQRYQFQVRVCDQTGSGVLPKE
ncbi:MAG: hypothetical protein U0996_02950 [Planctomycetaceae bacterium]